jgi:hypothetical protein
VDAAVPLLRRHYLLLVTASAVILAPALVLDVALPSSAAWVGGLVSRLLYVLLDAATISIVSESYLGNVPDLASTLRAVGNRSGALLAAAFLRGLLVGLGFLVLIIPGIVFYAWSFAMPMVVMLEGRRAGEAFSRSNELVRGDTARVLLTLFLGFVVLMLLVLAFGAGVGALTDVMGFPARTMNVLGELAMIFAYPIGSVISTLLYYDLRIRKEGFDLEVMAKELAA